MVSNGHCFVEWKEEFVSQERGNRVVHYFLKDSAGKSILAVVGTERSVRHMFYVVAEEFLYACGSESSAHAGFKWRSRREVVDWLTSMLSKQHLARDQSRSPAINRTHALGSSNLPMSAQRPNIPDYMGRISRELKGHDSDIVWSGVAWTCGKQLKHYPAFCRNGTTIGIHSFVFVMAKDEDHYLAYLEDMYEDRKRQKKVRVRWFHHNQELKGVIHLRNPHPKEVLITPYAQVISVECVDGPATVLTPEHYEKCLAVPHASFERIHLCFRQFKSNKVKAFDISKLRGYFDQADLLCLDPTLCHDVVVEDEDDFSTGENVKPGGKRTRSCSGRERFVRMMTHNPLYKNLKYGLSGKRLLSMNNIEPHLWHSPLYKVDQKIELLCQDSGIRGCWFRCTILQVSRKQIKVQYDDVVDEDGCGNLKEWIPAFRLAMPDKLGIRCSGRPTIRPAPSSDQPHHAFVVGAAVDAWWSDGWWEGVVIGIYDCEDESLQVYFPGENIFLNVERKNLRISRDWVGSQWVEIEAKPDIVDVLSTAISPDTKLSTSTAIPKDAKFNGLSSSCCKVSSSTKVNTIEEKLNLAPSDANFDGVSMSSQKDPTSVRLDTVDEAKLSSTVLANANGLMEDRELVHGEKQSPMKDDANDSNPIDSNNVSDDKENNDGGADNESGKLEDNVAQKCEDVEPMEIASG